MKKLVLFLGVFFSTLAIGAVNCGTGGDDCVCGNCPSNQIKIAMCMEQTKGEDKEKLLQECMQKVLFETDTAS